MDKEKASKDLAEILTKSQPVNHFGPGWFYNTEKKMTVYVPPKNKKKKKLLGDIDTDEEDTSKVIR
jgi:hypothetical protein